MEMHLRDVAKRMQRVSGKRALFTLQHQQMILASYASKSIKLSIIRTANNLKPSTSNFNYLTRLHIVITWRSCPNITHSWYNARRATFKAYTLYGQDTKFKLGISQDGMTADEFLRGFIGHLFRDHKPAPVPTTKL